LALKTYRHEKGQPSEPLDDERIREGCTIFGSLLKKYGLETIKARVKEKPRETTRFLIDICKTPNLEKIIDVHREFVKSQFVKSLEDDVR